MDVLFDVTNPGLWMAHCHIAEHMQSGMMFSFNVARPSRPDVRVPRDDARPRWLGLGAAEPLVRSEHSAGHRIA
ncbi:MAG TPA: multicopper oxidase domain-containing protein [Actinomycetes bacterium]|nr:multicopper oxidase domain-containing protein [Actinomycetes bacterium]